MKLFLLLLCASAFGATTVTDTIYTPTGGLFTGTVRIQASGVMVNGGTTYQPQSVVITVTNGVFATSLIANDASTPHGTYYRVNYTASSGQAWQESWNIPTTATVQAIAQVRVFNPAVTFSFSQFLQGAATDGQVISWDNTLGYWKPISATGLGSVTSVALTAPSVFSVSGSPIIGAGTLAMALATQTANTVWAGPGSGAAAIPAFRALVALDIPSLSYEPPISAGTTGQYWRGDKSWQSLATIATTGSASDLIAGTVSTTRLGSGSASSSTCLYGDQTYKSCGSGSGTISSGTTNTLPKYTASTTIGNSLLSDDATTLLYTGTGGLNLGGGSVAGKLVLLQGSQPSIIASSIAVHAPVSVTGYRWAMPAAAGTGFLRWTATGTTVTSALVSLITSGLVDNSVATTGGDIDTSSPSVVLKINGVSVSGTPSVGDVPTATSSSAATWQPQTGGSGAFSTLAGVPDVVRTNSTTLTINAQCVASPNCIVRFGNTSYTLATAPTAVITSTSAPGTARLYVASGGALTLGYDSNITMGACAAGVTCTSGVSAFPADCLPLYTWTASSNVWDVSGGTNWVSAVSTKNVGAGTGLLAADVGGKTTISLDTTAVVLPFFGSGTPGSIAGNLPSSVYLQDNGDIYDCLKAAGTAAPACTAVAAFNWVLRGSGSGGGSQFTGTTASSMACTGAVTISLSDVSVKSPDRFESCALSGNVTSLTVNNKSAGARFSLAWLQSASSAKTVSSITGACDVDSTLSTTTTQLYEVQADGSTVVPVTSCSTTSVVSKIPAFQRSGGIFSISGCSNSSPLGGNTAGSFVSGTNGTCTVTITMGDSAANRDWHCTINNRTHPENIMGQSGAASTTQATLTGNTTSGDLLSFACDGLK